MVYTTPVWRFFLKASSIGLGAELAEKGLIFMHQSLSPNVLMLSTKSLIALVLILVVIVFGSDTSKVILSLLHSCGRMSVSSVWL